MKKKRRMLFRMLLVLVLALSLCACKKEETGTVSKKEKVTKIPEPAEGGQSGTGDQPDTGNSAGTGNQADTGNSAGTGNQTGTGTSSGAGSQTETGSQTGTGSPSDAGNQTGMGAPADGNQGENDAEEVAFWVEQTGNTVADIYLKAPAVNRLKSDEDGMVSWLSIDFYVGEQQVLWCSLSADYINAAVYTKDSGGEPVIYNSNGDRYMFEAEASYPENTVCWHVYDRRVVDYLAECDRIEVHFYDESGEDDQGTILEYNDRQAVAGRIAKREKTDGVRLGFDGDLVYVDFYGRELMEFVKKKNETGSQSLTLCFGADPLFASECDISVNPNFLPGAGVYREDGTSKLLWAESGEDHVSLWFQAPGLEATVRSMPEYCIHLYDGPKFVGDRGIPADIICEYASYAIPELPEQFRLAEQAADEEYFKPITPYYIVTRYEYPAVPVTKDFQWYLINRLGPSYGFMSIDVGLTKATKLVLISYGLSGNVVQRQAKCVYESEEDAIRANVVRHDVLQNATGNTYGTEADYEKWIYDAFLTRGSNSHWMALHKGNVNYYKHSQVYISEADDMQELYMEPEKTGTGSYTYRYAYGHASGEDGEGTCTYESWASFDLDAVKKK